MSGEFNVFDEWGNYVGKFTPSGGGVDGCLFMIALIFLWTIGFLIYLVLRILGRILQSIVDAAKNGNWAYAVIATCILFLAFAIPVGYVVQSAAVSARAREESARQTALEAQELTELVKAADNVGNTSTYGVVQITKIPGLIPSENVLPDCVGGCGQGRGFWKYQVTSTDNSYDITIGLPSLHPTYGCFFDHPEFQSPLIEPGESLNVYCWAREDNNKLTIFTVRNLNTWEWENINIQLNPKTGLFELAP